MTIIAADSVGRKNKPMTELEAYLPFWGKLIPGQRELSAVSLKKVTMSAGGRSIASAC